MREDFDWNQQVEVFLKRIQVQSDAPRMKPCPRGVIRRVHQRVEAEIQKDLEMEARCYREIPERLFRMHEIAVERNGRRREQEVKDLLARLCEKYRARHGWLFTHESEGSLQARYAYRSNLRNQRIRLNEPSIISHVYHQKGSYAASDTSQDPYYLRLVSSTQSELAAAVMIRGVSGRDRVIGVVNLEADQPNRFTSEMCAEFEVDVQELALPLLLMEGVDQDDLGSWPINPGSLGWRSESVMKALCDEFLRTPNERSSPVSLSVTVWYVDWEHQVLWALATNGYDFEFLTESLPLRSFTGTIAQGKRKGVTMTSPEEEPLFLEKEKGEALGLRKILSAPIPSVHGNKPGLGALNLYQFHEAEPLQFPGPPAMRAFTRLLANVFEQFGELRERAACVLLDWKMREGLSNSAPESQPGVQLHVLMEVFRECVGADGCAILMADETENSLNVVTSCGLRQERIECHEGRWVSRRMPLRDLPLRESEPRGILARLYWNPGKPLRFNCGKEAEACRKSGTPPEEDPSNSHDNGEHLTPDLVERRFLGIGIELSERTRIVVRLVRSMNSPRFTQEDAELLQSLAEFCRRQDFWNRSTKNQEQNSLTRSMREDSARGGAPQPMPQWWERTISQPMPRSD